MVKKLNDTWGTCNICLKRINAEIIQKNNQIFIKKKCSKHGTFSSLHAWDDPDTYKFLMSLKKFGFSTNWLIIRVTNRCNLNCTFCYAMANDLRLKELTVKDISNLDIDKFDYIFLTGGEPTLNNDIFRIIKYLKKQKKKVFLLTNGIKLQRKSFVKFLKKSGINGVMLQFDSLSTTDDLYLRGIPTINKKIKSLENLNKMNIPVNLFSIQLKRNNVQSIKSLISVTNKFKNIIKGVILNTVWKYGRYKKKYCISSGEITMNFCKAINVNKKEILKSTELVYYLSNLMSSLGTKKRYFSRWMLFLPSLFYKDNIIPITQIFNVKKITEYLKSILIGNKKHKFINLIFYLAFYQFFINFFINRNFRLLMLQSIKNLRHLVNKNIFLLNPFTILNVADYSNIKNFDYNFASFCEISQEFRFKKNKITNIYFNPY